MSLTRNPGEGPSEAWTEDYYTILERGKRPCAISPTPAHLGVRRRRPAARPGGSPKGPSRARGLRALAGFYTWFYMVYVWFNIVSE